MRTRLVVALFVLITHAAFIPDFPNIEYVGSGYDIMFGNPHAVNQIDPGFRQAIFNVTVFNHKTPDGHYLLPQGVQAVKSISCSMGFQTDTINSGASYQEDLQRAIKADYQNWFFAFGANDDVKQVSSQTTNSNTYVSSSTSCEVYHAYIETYTPPPFTWNFMYAVASLPLHYGDYYNQSYFQLIESFGTHVVVDAQLGGRSGLLTEFTDTWYQYMQSEGINVQQAASYAVLLSSGVTLSPSQTQLAQLFQSYASSTGSFPTGSPIPPNGNINTWIMNSTENPMPLRYIVVPITSLMTKALFPNDTGIAVKRKLLTLALSEYCSYLMENGNIQYCNPPSTTTTSGPSTSTTSTSTTNWWVTGPSTTSTTASTTTSTTTATTNWWVTDSTTTTATPTTTTTSTTTGPWVSDSTTTTTTSTPTTTTSTTTATTNWWVSDSTATTTTAAATTTASAVTTTTASAVTTTASAVATTTESAVTTTTASAVATTTSSAVTTTSSAVTTTSSAAATTTESAVATTTSSAVTTTSSAVTTAAAAVSMP